MQVVTLTFVGCKVTTNFQYVRQQVHVFYKKMATEAKNFEKRRFY